MKYCIILLSVLCIQFTALSQQGQAEVQLAVTDQENHALENITVGLFRLADSVLVKATLSDAAGKVFFNRIASGRYFIKASSVQFTTYSSAAFEVTGEKSPLSLPAIQLQPANAASLSTVTVSARKPFIQKLSDRIVVNVDNSIVNAGSTAFDVLEKSPGVMIDPNDIISLRGKQGVIIMIDGKITPMSGNDLVNYLRGLPSGSIERLEIITNPSAKYDAAGNSGIIDIRLKKDQRLGANGTFTSGYGQGVYPKANSGTTFNYRNKKINVFGSYNYAYRQLLNHLFLKREFFDNDIYQGAYDQDNFMKFYFNSHNARLGMDFFPSKQTTWGFVVNSSFSDVHRKNRNGSLVLNNTKEPESEFITNNRENGKNRNLVANINFKHAFGNGGREITADADYGMYNNRSLTNFVTGFYELDGNVSAPAYILAGKQTGTISLFTVKTDYVHPLKKEAKLETGFKTSFVETDNDVLFLDESNGSPVYDSSKSNRFTYKENNHAAYLNYSKKINKWSLMAGLRAEQTNIKGVQLVTGESFDSSYLQLFPSVFINYAVKEHSTIGVSVSRRIDRPNYSELNPFRFFLDPSTYSSGNPNLRPQITWSYELSYTYKQLSITAAYSHSVNNFNIVIVPSETEDKVTIQMPVNLESYDYYGLSVSSLLRITKWWNSINNLNVYYGHYNGYLSGTRLDNGSPAVNAGINNSFLPGGGWTFELNGSYNIAGRYGFLVMDPRWQLSAGVQKQVLKKRGTITFNISDIFWTNLPQAVIEYKNYVEHWHAERDTRVANISFTYRFGKNTVTAARRRTDRKSVV